MRPRVCRHSQYMQRRDTMHLRNDLPRVAALFLLIFCCASIVIAQQTQPAQPSATSQSQAAQAQPSAPTGVHREGTDNILVDAAGVPLEDQSGKSVSQEAALAPVNPSVGSETVNIPNQKSGEVTKTKNGGFLIGVQVQEVVLHATVVDQRARLVTNLNKNDFTVYEDGQPQRIRRFTREENTVLLGILIDNSAPLR